MAAFHVKTLCYNSCFLCFIAEHREILHKAILVMHPGDLQSEIKKDTGYSTLTHRLRPLPDPPTTHTHDMTERNRQDFSLWGLWTINNKQFSAFICGEIMGLNVWVKGNQFLFSFQSILLNECDAKGYWKNWGWDFKHLDWKVTFWLNVRRTKINNVL